MGTSKMAQVLGIVNACRPDMAARDALDVTRIKDMQGAANDFALENAAAIAAATAEALRPGASVDSVIATALAQLPDERGARKEVQEFLRLANGRPREAILNAINIGRDTDCKAYVAGGLAGALKGIEALPSEWVETVEKAVATDPYTIDKRTARQIAEGLHKAFLNELRKTKVAVDEAEAWMGNK